MVEIVKDSSVWLSDDVFLKTSNNNELKLGIIRFQEYDEKKDCFFYTVEALGKGSRVMFRCRQMCKFGDIYNYEEYTPRFNNKKTSNSTEQWNYASRVGEIVIVSMLDGGHTDGVIIGSMKHPGRKTKIKKDEYAYYSSYNGIETFIDKDGAWKITFNGIPTNENELYSQVSNQLPEPMYDSARAGSFVGIDKEGSIEISDLTSSDPQIIKIDKKAGTINVKSGTISIKLDKKSKAIEIVNKDTKVESSNSFSIKTKDLSLDCSSTKIKASKIAIGYGGTELIDSIIKIVDALGKLVINSPNGPCSPFQTAPTWTEILSIKTKLNSIKGSL